VRSLHGRHACPDQPDRALRSPGCRRRPREPKFLDDELDTLLNPILIVEVLSPSTEYYDKEGKFQHYCTLKSLKEYILVAQDRILVERRARQRRNWAITVYRNIGETLVLESIGCAIPLREIDAKVKLAESKPSDR
jgi:Uma2 family endonuclease